MVESVRAHPSQAFNEAFSLVDITPEERAIGIETKQLFDSKLKRRRPWLIRAGRITVLKPNLEPGPLESNPGSPPLMTLTSREIPTCDIEHERISPLLAEVMMTFKRIEDKLPDFTGRSAGKFRNVWGINNSYHQWASEENQHSDALALVVEATGHRTRDEIADDYYENLAKTWELPFDTQRQMVLYAAFQEQLTSLNYRALAFRAMEEDAPTVAEVMSLISHDEAYHGGGYRAFARVYAKHDLEGTIDDALHVARNFRMPAQHLMRDRKRNSVDIVRVGAFSKSMVTDGTIYRVLNGLQFVPEDSARKTASEYWSK